VACSPRDVVVFAAGVRPRDEFGPHGRLTVGAGRRGGRQTCRTSRFRILRIGDAEVGGRVYGLVAP